MSSLKLGVIGLDTSHCIAFTDLLNNAEHAHHIPAARVVCAFPGGSQELAVSRDRVEGFTARMQSEFAVEIVDSLAELAQRCDAILHLSGDGRKHLEEFQVIAPFGKPVFIDKPLATTAREARAIFALAKEHDAPVMSCSSVRYARGFAELGAGQEIFSCEAAGPATILDDFPGLFWYGIHPAEILFSKMGTGCQQVFAHRTPLVDMVSAVWQDGRVGLLHGHRYPKFRDYALTLYTPQGVLHGLREKEPPAYASMLQEVMEFFRTRVAPIPEAETVELIAFLEAANESRSSGQVVKLPL